MYEKLIESLNDRLNAICSVNISPLDLHKAVGGSVMEHIQSDWKKQQDEKKPKKRAAYLSAEFLVGRAVYNNLLSLGLTDTVKKAFDGHGLDFGAMEDMPEPALGNGGLGRLAACYLDSAATKGIPLDGYGIRYRFGLFRQRFENGFQRESADDWYSDTDPWFIRRDADAVEVTFAGQTVTAVPYDMPVIGYGGGIGRLRLWQAEASKEFDYDRYLRSGMPKGFTDVVDASCINALLYPDDSKRAGRELRLRQQYFFCDASIQDMCRDYVKNHGTDFSKFPDYYAIQLNDTHPTLAIPAFIRLLTAKYDYLFDDAFEIARRTFSYTNHTVMPEALEKWDLSLLHSVIPDVYDVLVLIDNKLRGELISEGTARGLRNDYYISTGGQVHMARLAVYASSHTNGVSEIHSEILKKDVLSPWYKRYPERFLNVTNGVTQRRWLALCNPELSSLITELLGNNSWITELSQLGGLRKYADDSAVLERFEGIKQRNKERLARYIEGKCSTVLDTSMIFDVQIKRVHEYKRQLLNALGILDMYFSLKDGGIPGFQPTAFIFGGKAAPGYVRAKGIIRFINKIAERVNSDPAVSGLMQVCFMPDYNVTGAEKLIPAAQLSEQISTAGTEASGTGNMKLSLNGAITVGTYDGANIEIFRDAGEENNFIFGARVEDIAAIRETYDPMSIYEANPRLRRVVDCLIDKKFGGGEDLQELRDSLLEGASWHKPDHYYLFQDFDSYNNCRLDAIKSYSDKKTFYRKAFLNTAGCGGFSSDYSVMEYAANIWGI